MGFDEKMILKAIKENGSYIFQLISSCLLGLHQFTYTV
jgi:hypothetical protein